MENVLLFSLVHQVTHCPVSAEISSTGSYYFPINSIYFESTTGDQASAKKKEDITQNNRIMGSD
jgi:hypothetical protein